MIQNIFPFGKRKIYYFLFSYYTEKLLLCDFQDTASSEFGKFLQLAKAAVLN